MAPMNFGEFVRQLRIDREISLRQCCLDLEVDPSNWSKLERGLATPPKHGDILERWAAFFGLAADKRQEFFDLAALARGELPADVASDARALAALPDFFRALRGSELQRNKLSEFAEEASLFHSPEPAEVRPRPQGNRFRSQAQRRMLQEPRS